MKQPKNLKSWAQVKNQRTDLSRLHERGLTPENYYYQCNSGIWYPVICKSEWNQLFNCT